MKDKSQIVQINQNQLKIQKNKHSRMSMFKNIFIFTI